MTALNAVKDALDIEMAETTGSSPMPSGTAANGTVSIGSGIPESTKSLDTVAAYGTHGAEYGLLNVPNGAHAMAKRPSIVPSDAEAAEQRARIGGYVVNEPVTVVLRDLSVIVDRAGGSLEGAKKLVGLGSTEAKDPIRLVKGVNATIPAGKVTAIMGASGAGKTTLLNSIAARLSGSARPVGQILFNGVDVVPLGKTGRGERSAYVKQDDTLLPHLTVRETLRFNAELRLPPSVSRTDKNKLVEDVILELNLKEAADTIVGSGASSASSVRGCSSGERRLVSIGIQLLSSPSLLLLDEPTSSTDSFTSMSICQTLEAIAKEQHRTVILSVHQPRYSTFELFDHLILLCFGGRLVYSGPVAAARPYFEALLGTTMPTDENPADWLLDLSSVDYSSPKAEAESKARLELLADAWTKRGETLLASPVPVATALSTQSVYGRGFGRFFAEVSAILRRGYLNTIRDKGSLLGVVVGALFFGLVQGIIFYQLPNDLASVRSRQTLCLMVASQYGYLTMILWTYLIARDVTLFDADRVEGIVGIASWVTSMFLNYLPLVALSSLVFTPLLFFMAGLSASYFGWFLGASFLTGLGYWSTSFLCVAVMRSYQAANTMTNTIAIIPGFATGFTMAIETIPVWLAWTRFLVTTYYAYQITYISMFRGQNLGCPYPPGIPECAPYQGDNVIRQIGFDPNANLGLLMLYMVFSIAGFILVGSIALKFITKEPVTAGVVAESRAVRLDGDEEVEANGKGKSNGDMVIVPVGNTNTTGHRTLEQNQEVHVMADALSVELSSFGFAFKAKKKRILENVSMVFESYKLTVILGSGGSGKTSLLNAICNLRPGNGFLTKTTHFGGVRFGATVNPSTGVVVRYAAYVRKEKDLFPALTVRETLTYAAELRLYAVPAAERRDRIEQVIRSLGLTDCANTLVGDENLKGISGGEQRRVCIALGILEPSISVLLLDEPTTGLDSSAAMTIIRVLRRIADTGRTVILSSQQTSRPEAFNMFDNVLLLARGGEIAYAGPRTGMVPFFESLGFEIPPYVQPGDYVIDLSSIDLRNQVAEVESRARVANIVGEFGRTGTKGVSEAGAVGAIESLATDGNPPAGVSLTSTKEEGKRRTPFLVAVPVLIRRTFKNFTRKPHELVDYFAMPCGFGLIALVFYESSIRVANYLSIQNTLGALFQFPGIAFMALLMSAGYFPPVRDLFYREFVDGVTSVESFVASQLLVELPLTVAGLAIFMVMFCTGLGLALGFGADFAITLFVLTCFSIFGKSMGFAILTIIDNLGMGLVVASSINVVAVVLSGIGAQSPPAWIAAINNANPLKWGIGALTYLQFREATYTCDPAVPGQAYPNGTCIVTSGQQVLQTLSLQDVNVGMSIGICAAISVASRLIYYGLLKFKLNRMVS